MTYQPEPQRGGQISPEFRALLIEWQRADLLRVRAIRAMLGLPPVEVVRPPRKGKGESDE